MKMYRKVVLSIFVSSACQSSRQDFKFTSLAVQRDPLRHTKERKMFLFKGRIF
jgi:hypothetical protein